MASNKRKSWTYQEKYDIIRFTEANPGLKKVDIALKFNIKKQTLADILKNKETIISVVEKTDKVAKDAGTVKRVRKVSYDKVDAALLLWFRQKAALPDVRIDSEMLRLKAEYFAREFGHEEPNITPAWIERFRKRWGIGKVRKCGEAGSVDPDVVSTWKSGKLIDILERYNPEDIYNADETGLFYELLPENTLGFIGETVHGGKQKKSRITILVAANMQGSDKLPLFVIGKSKKPRAFKGCKHLPTEYTANKKAWMTSVLFEDWLRKLDNRMGREHRKICMIVDNCPAHPDVNLENIELVFLPPNTTSITQPMDGGIIKNLKFHYRRILATRRLEATQKDDRFNWNILDALFTIRAAWNNVKQSTIANVYSKVGFVPRHDEDQALMFTVPTGGLDDEENRRELRNVWDMLREVLGQAVPENMDQYLNIDANETEVYPVMTDGEITECVLSQTSSSVESEVFDDEEETDDGMAVELAGPPTIKATHDAVDTIRRFALTLPSSSDSEDVLKMAQKVEVFLINETPKRLRQTTIFDYMQA